MTCPQKISHADDAQLATEKRTADLGVVDCSVLVPVLNEEDHIAAAIGAMRQQQFRGRLEFLIVDGGSTDRTPEILSQLAREEGRIRLLENPGRAIPAGLNIGLRNARGRWVARMDAHSEYPADYVELGVNRLLQGGTRWVSGPQLPVGRNAVARSVALAIGHPLGRGGSRRWATDGGSEPEYELDTGVFCGVWARETLLDRGGWDERWPRNEDSEMAARFLELGERLVCLPAMAAIYRPRESLGALWRQYLENGEFRARTARWHPDTLRRSNLLPPALVLAGAVAVAAPRRVRAWLWPVLWGYGTLMLAAGLRSAGRAERKREAALVPVVLTVMHVGFGTGFLRGIRRHGVPVAALAATAGLPAPPNRPLAPAGSVFAPSLHE